MTGKIESKSDTSTELLYCTRHNFGPVSKDSQRYKEHIAESKGKCKQKPYDPKKHIPNYENSVIDGKHKFYFIDGSAQITQDILNKNIETLRPQTILKDNTKMILVYLPTKQEITKGTGENITTTFKFLNSAYFVICDKSGKKKILPFNDKSLIENYRIKVLSEWNDTRWNVSDLKKWETQKTKTNPKELYELINETTRKYLEFATESEYTKFNLWNIATYFFELFDSFPYNDYTGMKRAGKTKSLLFQKLVCFNSIMSADITSSATFRIIEGIGSTVLLDETESFKDKKNEQAQAIRNILMQGFLKDQYAVRNETTKDNNFTPTQYNLYSPKSMAHISTFDDVLEERCIQQILRRALNETVKNTWCSEEDKAFSEIRNLCYRLFMDYADEINKLQDEARKLLKVNSRELQLWTPIITLALFFKKYEIPNLINDIQLSVSQSSSNRQLDDEQETKELRVLEFLDKVGVMMAHDKQYLGNNPLSWIPISTLFNQLKTRSSQYEIPEWYVRKHLTESLRKLGFKQSKKEGGYSWFITRSVVDEVKQRMDVSDKDKKLDDFKGGIKNTSGHSGTSDTSEIGIKSTDSKKSDNSKTSGTSGLDIDSSRKTEHSEVSEANARKQDPSIISRKTEHSEVSEVSKNKVSSVTSGSSGASVSKYDKKTKVKSYSKKKESSKSFNCKTCEFNNFINFDTKSRVSDKTLYQIHIEKNPKHKLEYSDEVIL